MKKREFKATPKLEGIKMITIQYPDELNQILQCDLCKIKNIDLTQTKELKWLCDDCLQSLS